MTGRLHTYNRLMKLVRKMQVSYPLLETFESIVGVRKRQRLSERNIPVIHGSRNMSFLGNIDANDEIMISNSFNQLILFRPPQDRFLRAFDPLRNPIIQRRSSFFKEDN